MIRVSRGFGAGRVRRAALTVLVAGLLAGCADDDPIIQGEREPVRPNEAAIEADLAARARPISLPAPVANQDWTHANGSADGRRVHAALASVPQMRWTADIGQGDDKRNRITTTPVVAGGLIFVMDSHVRVSAHNTSGARVWTAGLVPEGQDPENGFGGGMAVAGGSLFVTTGFGEVISVGAATGQVRWRRQFDAPIRSAPSVRDGRVYVVLRNDTALALDAGSGETVWEKEGYGGSAGLLGGASIAVDGSVAVVPFSTGEVLGLSPRTGLQQWGTAITGGRGTLARGQINDISGDPVIEGGFVTASSQNGRTIRVNKSTGERIWTAVEGAYGPAWPVGGSLFIVSDRAELVRLNAADGSVIWSQTLPQLFPNTGWFGNEKTPYLAIPHYGPVLAGGRLWIAGGDAMLRAFDPVDGRQVAEIALPDGAAASPVVAGGVMYVVGTEGQLHALR